MVISNVGGEPVVVTNLDEYFLATIQDFEGRRKLQPFVSVIDLLN